ncbi:MAG: LacI family DNA-binding transcriptional regulator [Phycisphaerales bacterium]
MGIQDTSPDPSARGGRGSVSIRSVAERSGVSIATVSRALNTPERVSPATIEKVRLAVAELGYRPNLFAKGLLTRRSRVIGVSLPDIHGDFYSELMRSADERARELGYHVLVSSNAHRPEDGPANAFALDLADGLIVMLTERSRVDLAAIAQLELPAVVIGIDRPGVAVDTISFDNVSGTIAAVAHLLEGTPANRCYFVGGHVGNLDSDERTAAFVEALRRDGSQPSPDQIAHGEYTFDWGWEWAARMIKQDKLRGAGVLTGNDEIAIGVANAARDHGLTLPKDFRLVGFDDSHLSSFMRPKLSSVRLPVADLGAEAVNALIRRLENPDSAPRHARLAATLVVRDSSAMRASRTDAPAGQP